MSIYFLIYFVLSVFDFIDVIFFKWNLIRILNLVVFVIGICVFYLGRIRG